MSSVGEAGIGDWKIWPKRKEETGEQVYFKKSPLERVFLENVKFCWEFSQDKYLKVPSDLVIRGPLE